MTGWDVMESSQFVCEFTVIIIFLFSILTCITIKIIMMCP